MQGARSDAKRKKNEIKLALFLFMQEHLHELRFEYELSQYL